ncbi:MAG: hypothetical protein A3B70_01825 [Deltaproteobacteria bacterium RIFCSPHIGHO2_02_FULL_40_11]|nr:MAG: hypothetical protein A3B70_01825 [Deltaproteobacteria bacterium RIFCSPHIGHO2_02_FULL_40_11]
MKKILCGTLVVFGILILSKNALTKDRDRIFEYPYIEGEILVRFLSNVQTYDKEVMVQDIGAQTIEKDMIVPNLELIELKDGQSVEEALRYFEQLPGVKYATPNYLVSTQAGIFPPREFPDPDPQPGPGFNDPLFARSYGIRMIDAPKAWTSFTFGNRDIIVAVIDTGVDYNHEDLNLNMWVNANEIPGNGMDDDGNGFIDDIHGWNFVSLNNDPMDDNHHGTHVAGTIGALVNNQLGTIGVSPHVSIMPCKFLGKSGWGSVHNAVQCVTYAVDNGAKVLNNSWGGGGFSEPLLEAIQMAKEAGVLFIAASGNYNQNNDEVPLYPATYDVENIISVAAVDAWDQKASFSNYGATTVDVAAPGVAIYSTFPNNLYDTLSGTSMATPHVSGAIALLWAHKPHLTALEIKDLLLNTVEPIPAMKDISVTGGRINVYDAMAFSILSR